MKDEALNTITDELVFTGTFLQAIAVDEKMKQCLLTFQRCQKLRKWLIDVTNGQ